MCETLSVIFVHDLRAKETCNTKQRFSINRKPRSITMPLHAEPGAARASAYLHKYAFSMGTPSMLVFFSSFHFHP